MDINIIAVNNPYRRSMTIGNLENSDSEDRRRISDSIYNLANDIRRIKDKLLRDICDMIAGKISLDESVKDIYIDITLLNRSAKYIRIEIEYRMSDEAIVSVYIDYCGDIYISKIDGQSRFDGEFSGYSITKEYMKNTFTDFTDCIAACDIMHILSDNSDSMPWMVEREFCIDNNSIIRLYRNVDEIEHDLQGIYELDL